MPTLSENLIRSLLTKRQKPEDIDRFRSIAAQAVDPSVDINTLPSPFEQEGTGVNRFLKGVFGVPTSSELNQSFFQQAAQARVPFQTERLKQEGEAKQAKLDNILKLSEKFGVPASALESPTVGQALLERLLATTGKETEEAKLGSDVATQERALLPRLLESRLLRRGLEDKQAQSLLNLTPQTDLTSPENALMFAQEGRLPAALFPQQPSELEQQLTQEKLANIVAERELTPLQKKAAELAIEKTQAELDQAKESLKLLQSVNKDKSGGASTTGANAVGPDGESYTEEELLEALKMLRRNKSQGGEG